MDFQLTEQQRRIVAAVRDLAQGEFKANAKKYMDGTFPWENMKKLADIGVLGMSVPEEYGGLDRLPDTSGLPQSRTSTDRPNWSVPCHTTGHAVGSIGTAISSCHLSGGNIKTDYIDPVGTSANW